MGCIKGEHDTSFCGTRGKREREQQGKGGTPPTVTVKVHAPGRPLITVQSRPDTPSSSVVTGRQTPTPDSSIVLARQPGPAPTTTVVQTRQPPPSSVPESKYPSINMGMPRSGTVDSTPPPVVTVRTNGGSSNGKPSITVTVARPAETKGGDGVMEIPSNAMPARPSQNDLATVGTLDQVKRPDVSGISPLDLPVQPNVTKRTVTDLLATPQQVVPVNTGVGVMPQLTAVTTAGQMASAMGGQGSASVAKSGTEAAPMLAQGGNLTMTSPVKPAGWAMDYRGDAQVTSPAGEAVAQMARQGYAAAGAPMGDASLPGKVVFLFLNMTPCAQGRVLDMIPRTSAAMLTDRVKAGIPGADAQAATMAKDAGELPVLASAVAKVADKENTAPAGWAMMERGYSWAGAPSAPAPAMSCATAFRSLPRAAQLRIMLGPSAFASESAPRALAVRLSETGDAAHANAFVAWLRTRYAPDSPTLAVICGLIDAEARRAGLAVSPAGDAMAQMARAGYSTAPAFTPAGMAAMDSIDRDLANAIRRAAADEQASGLASAADRFGYRASYGPSYGAYRPAGGPVPANVRAVGVTQAMWDAAANTPGGQALLQARVATGQPLFGGSATATTTATATPPRPGAAAPTSNGIVPAEIAARGVTQEQWNAMPADQARAAREEIAAGNAAAAQQRTLTAIGSALSTAATQARELINSLNQQALANRTHDNQEANAQRQQELALFNAETDRQLRTLAAQQAQASGSGDSATAATLAALMQQLQSSQANANRPPPEESKVPTWALVGGGVAILGGLGFVGYKAMNKRG